MADKKRIIEDRIETMRKTSGGKKKRQIKLVIFRLSLILISHVLFCVSFTHLKKFLFFHRDSFPQEFLPSTTPFGSWC